MRHCDNVSTKMRPVVRIRNLGDNGIDWEVKFWVEDYAKFNDTDALVRERIWYAFQREKIHFAYPTRSVHVEEPKPENGQPKKVNELAENDFFGEMSLLTGQPRTANVIATVETEVLQIRKNALKPILESNPVLVQSITDIIDERLAMLSKLDDDKPENADERKKGVMRSIRKFFGIRSH